MKSGSSSPARDGDPIEEIVSGCVMMRSRLISRVITNLYDDELRPFGINSPQFALLVVISKMGPASRAEIGRYHHQDRSTLTRNLKIMLAEGWIEEVKEAASGRARPIVLSESGRSLLREACPAWRVAQEKAEKLVGSPGVTAIKEIARGILTAGTTA